MKKNLLLLAALAAVALAGCETVKVRPVYDPVGYKPKNPANVRVKVSLQDRMVYVMEGNKPLLVTATAIGLPETRVGIVPGGGGTQRLPRVIGEARALEMILRGRVVAAADALAIGLVHEVADDCVARALEIAAEFEARPPEGLAYAKRLIRSALDRPLSEGLSDERRSFVEVVRLPSAVSAMKASLANAPLGTAEPS